MRYNDVTMKHINLFTAMLFLLLFVAGCSENDKETIECGTTVITVRIADNVDTRTAVDENGNVSWLPTDCIGVFGSEGSINVPFSLMSENNGTARFIGELADNESPEVIYYPYIEDISLNGNTLRVAFPTEYEYTGNTYGPMLGTRNEDGSFTFNHLAAMIKLKINVPEEATALVITSDFWSPDISGAFIVKDITSADAVLEENNLFTSNALKVLIPSSMRGGMQTFYIPLPALTYDKLTVALNVQDEKIWSKSLSNVTLKRGVLLEMPEVVDIKPMMVITSHTDGQNLEGYGAIQTITMKGYVDNLYSFTGSITLHTEERREFIYDGYWNPVELPGENLQGARSYFETDVELHRGKNVYTINMKGKNAAGETIDESYDITLIYNENDEPAEAVDLGLSVKWASHNLDASKPEELGWSYVWADNTGTDVKHRDDYSKVTFGDVLISGNGAYDAATYKWKGLWRMPTAEEFAELLELSKGVDVVNGVEVWRFVAENGNSIIMPVADYWTGVTSYDIFGSGIDRSAALLVDNNASDILYNHGLGWAFRHFRLYIRPVYGE